MPRAKDPASAPTLVDVAREAGVSLATASRVLNGSERRVADAYRRRVLVAAARLNYSPNLSAQAVAGGRSASVALVVSDITDPYFSTIAAGVFRAAEHANLIVTISVSERRPEKELRIVEELRRHRPRILVLVGSRHVGEESATRLSTELRAFESEGGRVALVSQEGLPFDTVALENREAAEALARRLVTLGYRRFALLAGPRELLTARDRSAGYLAGIAAGGAHVPEAAVIEGPFTRDGGYAAAGELLRRELEVDVVLAANDVMAVGAMARFREAGIAMPGHLAIAGFDDIGTLRDVTPSLTTVRVPLESLGEQAVALALARAGGEPTVVRVGGEIVVRESTPPVPRRGRSRATS